MERENRVKFKIGEIEFETEGAADVVERERNVFLTTILPAAVDAIVNIRGTKQASQYIQAVEQTSIKLAINDNENNDVYVVNDGINDDLSRTSLSSFMSKYGRLSDVDFVLVAAYYDEKKNGVVSFTTENVKQYYIEARRSKYSNNSDLVKRLVQKGHIMDDPYAEKKLPKPYKLTEDGIRYVESYQPKEDKAEKSKVSKPRRTRTKNSSIYWNLNPDELNLNNYPVIKEQDSFKKQMLLVMYIIMNEGKGDTFSVSDIEYLMTDVLGLPTTIDKINGVFKRNKIWFKSGQDENNKKANRNRLLQGAKDFVQMIIDENKSA